MGAGGVTPCTKCGKPRLKGGSTNPSGLCRLCFHEQKRAAAEVWACSKCGAPRSRGGGTRKEGGLCRACYRASVNALHPSARKLGPRKARHKQQPLKVMRAKVPKPKSAAVSSLEPAWWTRAPREGWAETYSGRQFADIRIPEPNREYFEVNP